MCFKLNCPVSKGVWCNFVADAVCLWYVPVSRWFCDWVALLLLNRKVDVWNVGRWQLALKNGVRQQQLKLQTTNLIGRSFAFYEHHFKFFWLLLLLRPCLNECSDNQTEHFNYICQHLCSNGSDNLICGFLLQFAVAFT